MDWIAGMVVWFRSFLGIKNSREGTLRLLGIYRSELDAVYRELTHLARREALLMEDGAVATHPLQRRKIALKVRELRNRTRICHCKMYFLEREVDNHAELSGVMASDVFLDSMARRAEHISMSTVKVEEFCRVAQEKMSAAVTRSDMLREVLRDTERQFSHSLSESPDRELDEIINALIPFNSNEVPHEEYRVMSTANESDSTEWMPTS